MGEVAYASPSFKVGTSTYVWSVSNVAGGLISELSLETRGTRQPILHHGRKVAVRVQPDLEPGRFYWSVDFERYVPARRSKRPARPHLRCWGSEPTRSEARSVAVSKFLSLSARKDVEDGPERPGFGW